MRKKELWSTFRGNNNFPVYNWFYFTEAYSRGLVREIILKNPIKSSNPVLYDPFCGTGTSLLVAKEFGYQAFGTDISYLMYLVSKAKCLNFNVNTIEKLLPMVLQMQNNEPIKIPKENEWIKKYFYSENLQNILQIKQNIDNIKEQEKHFFYIVLLATIEVVSRARKQGQDLRLRKVEQMDVIHKFQKRYNLFLKEYKKFTSKYPCKYEPEILNESCLTFYKTHEQLFDYIICSPPYLNKTEYTKRFGIELAILGKETILQEHLGHSKHSLNDKDEWVFEKHFKKELERIKEEQYKNEEYSAREYFKQLETFVNDSTKHLKKTGVLAIVIAGGVIGTTIFEIYNYMQDLYLLNGLNIVDIKTNRDITCNINRTTKLGTIKEFTIVGKKD